MENNFLFSVFIFLATACITVPIASRFKLGSVLGYLIAGIIIGPFGLKLIGNAEQIMSFAEFGVVMMLFVIGLELEPALLWRMRKSLVGLGSLQVILSSLLFMLVGMALGFDWRLSLAGGMSLSLSSTALVLQMLQEKKLMHTAVGEVSFSVLLFQDIAVIPILILMPLLATTNISADNLHEVNFFSNQPGWIRALLVTMAIGLVITVGRFCSPYLFRAIARTNLREVFTATSLALVVGITLLMKLVGVSPALGAFIAGVVLANSEYRRTLETDIEPFKGLLLGLFFISIGMAINFDLLVQKPLQLLSAMLIIVSIKAVILFFVGKWFGLFNPHRLGFALALSQSGEFAFVLFQFAGELQIFSSEQTKFLMLVVALSIAATPLLMLFYRQIAVPRFMSTLPQREFDQIDKQHPIILAGYGRFGQVIGRFLTAQGIKVTILDNDPDQIELLRKFGHKGYFGDASRLDLLRSAGADKASLLIIAVDDADVCLEIALLAKQEFPHLKVFARARNRRHAYELHKAGVDYFKRETFDSSLEVAKKVMEFLGSEKADIRVKAREFKRHDEKTLIKSFEFFDSEPELVDFYRLQRAELERILKESDGKVDNE